MSINSSFFHSLFKFPLEFSSIHLQIFNVLLFFVVKLVIGLFLRHFNLLTD